jgi:Type II CAAX prenyl endopeptidase Rce1-like
MGQSNTSYFWATRHPWPCLVFLLPLLAAYEGGVVWLGGTQAQAVRNGADAWLRWGFEVFGITALLAVPAAVVAILFIWTAARWRERPGNMIGVCFGMTMESVLFAFGLWAVSRNFGRLVEALGLPLATQFTLPADTLAQIVTFVGAGIYEEVLFRLILFAGLAAVLRCVFLPGWLALLVAAAASALLFAGAHHIGPYGEPIDPFVFLFRVTAGLYFTLLFWARGFGIAVGAHAGYDVLVGVSWT